MSLEKLPVGIQSFPKIIEQGYLYVDKTEIIYRLVTEGQLYFLSRPRRFGKSVLLSTLEALYQGRRELFKDLYIEDRWNFEPRPVIRLDFLGVVNSEPEVLKQSIIQRLDEEALKYDLSLSAEDCANRFRELILTLARRGQRVVVLIDEYDKPILDQIGNLERAKANKAFLATFYAVLKSVEHHLEFLFLTGVSKFTRVSLFSDLNNLKDLTLHPRYAAVTGFTEDELSHYFGPYLERGIDGLGGEALRERMRRWYNGYSWDGKTRVYNPVSVLELFDGERFGSFWFATGTPKFLLELLRKGGMEIPRLERLELRDFAMEGFDPEKVDPIALLFQTGYLTIRSVGKGPRRRYRLGFPNQEVKEAFLTYILAEFSASQPGQADDLAAEVGKHLITGDLDAFCDEFRALFASIPYNIFLPNHEAYYHTVVYLVLSLMGITIAAEIQTNRGRIDAVLETDDRYYVVEFKLGTPEEALQQIQDKDYALPYLNRGKQVVLLGIGIDPEERNISRWKTVMN